MTHGHFRGCLRFSFAEVKKPAIYIFFPKSTFIKLSNDISEVQKVHFAKCLMSLKRSENTHCDRIEQHSSKAKLRKEGQVISIWRQF